MKSGSDFQWSYETRNHVPTFKFWEIYIGISEESERIA